VNIDVENERFSLGIKQLHPDPWTELPTKYPIGAGEGPGHKVADFGAFVEIEPGIEGLVTSASCATSAWRTRGRREGRRELA